MGLKIMTHSELPLILIVASGRFAQKVAMSAYGEIRRISRENVLPSTIWSSSWETSDITRSGFCTIHHLTLQTARDLPGLLEFLCVTFAKEIEDGATYPQEGEMDQGTFENYFFAADVFLGIIGTTRSSNQCDGNQIIRSIEDEKGERNWEDCIAGFYYVKPNYPGRSSHICNAGFVVAPKHRGQGFGKALSKSFLHYAPLLGYQASIFNLVYVNNQASIKLWEKLGFTKIGRIPRAGRLRTNDGKVEEYVDAWVIYKSFHV